MRGAHLVLIGLALAAHGATADDGTRQPRVIRVAPGTPIASLADAARVARDGDIVEVQPGDYRRDVAVWEQRGLTVRAVGGRARLIADGASAEDKAIWVVRGDLTAENLDFVGARVPDGNGAGIRFERGRLVLRHCGFVDNQNGILGGSDPDGQVFVENSVFRRNGTGDGRTHHLYVARIGRLVVRSSYFSEGRVGHLLKSGARETQVLYSRLTDEAQGKASYELELPYGGIAIVIGNLIQQDAGTENRTIVSFGAEGYRWDENALYVAHNTIVNDFADAAVFVAAAPGNARARVVNNVLVGKGGLDLRVPAELAGNARLGWTDVALPMRLDYRLKAAAAAAHAAVDPGMAGKVSLWPEREYVHPADSRALDRPLKLLPGAFQDVAANEAAKGAQ
jgi:hypothetical protein